MALTLTKLMYSLSSCLIAWLIWLLYINNFLPTSSLTIFSFVTLASVSAVFLSALVVCSINVYLIILELQLFAVSLFSTRKKAPASATTVTEVPSNTAAAESSLPSAILAQSKSLNAISPMPKTRLPLRNTLDSTSSSIMNQSGLNSFNPEDSSLFGKASRAQQQQQDLNLSSSTIGGGLVNRRDGVSLKTRPFDTPSAAARVGITFAPNEGVAAPPPTPSSSLRRRRGSASYMMDLSTTPFSVAKAPRLPLPRDGGRGAYGGGAVDVSDLNTSGFGFAIAPGFDDGALKRNERGGALSGRGSVGARDLGLDRASLASTMWDNNESRLRERISTAQEIELRSKKTDTTQSQQLLSIQQHQQRINRSDPVLTFDVFGGEVHDAGKGFGAWRSRRPMDDALGGFSSSASVSAAASAGLREQHEYLDGFTTSTSSSSFSQDYQHQRFNAAATRGGIISGGQYAQAEHASASDLRFEVKAAELPRRAYFHGLSAGNGSSGTMNGATSPISPLSSGFDYNSKDPSSSSSSGTILQHSSFQDLRAQSTAVFRFIQWHITHYYLPWLQKNADDILNAPKPVSGLVHDYSMPFLLREPGDDSFWRKTQQKFSALGIGYGGLSDNGRSGLSLSQSFPLRVVKRIVLPEPPQQQQPQQQQQQQQPQQQGFAFFTQPSAAPSSFLSSSSSSSSSVVTNDDLATKLLRDAHAAAAKYGLAPMSLDTLIQNMVFMDETAIEIQGPIRKEKKEDTPAAGAQGVVSAFSAMPAFGSSFAPPAPPAPPPLPPHSSAWYVRIVEGRKTINRKITEGKSKGLETSPRKAVHLFQEKADLESFLWGGPGLSNSSAAAAAALGADAFDLRAYVLWRLRELVSDNTALSITTSHPEEDLLRPLADFMGDQVGLSSIKGSSLGISLASSSSSSTSTSSSFGAGLGALLQAASVGRPLFGAGGGIADGAATPQQLALLPSDAQIVFHYFVTMMDDLVAQRLRSNDLVRMQERILYGRALNHSASDHHGIGAGFADSTKAPSVTDRIASSVFVSYGDVTSSSHSRAVDGGLLSFNRNDGVGGSTLFSLGQAVRGHEPTRHASLRFRLNCRSEGGSEGGKFDAAVLIDGRPVLTTDPQDIGHGAKISLPRSLALWAQMQASQANGELAVHRNCVVNLQPELLSLVGL